MYATRFTVEGGGQFPFDMLRYDGCYPATQEDVTAMVLRRPSERRQVLLETHHPRAGANGLTDERWRSFGWRIIEVNQPIKCA
jgi:hypothetical protein